MDIAVTTVITDPRGHEKRRSQSTIHFTFHGYNPQSRGFSFNSRSGWFNTGALRDSRSGDHAVFIAFSLFAPNKENESEFEIRQERPGHAVLIGPSNRDCHRFEMLDRVLFPKTPCASVEFKATTDSTGELTPESFSLEIGALPAPAKIAYLGDVQIQKFSAEGNIQKVYLPADPQPFFLPKQVITSIVTDKGAITLTNLYKLTPNRSRKN